MGSRYAPVDLAPGTAADVALVDRIMAEAFDPRYGEAWTTGQCLGILAMPGVWLTIAQVDGVAAGFAMARSVFDEAELLLLGVRPSFRRRGIGGALLRSVMVEARGRGVARMHLEMRAGNDAAALYRVAGFEQVGTRRNYYRGRDGQLYDAHSYAQLLREPAGTP